MKSLYYLLFIWISLVGCADIYSPITPNITKFSQKYEFHGEIVGCLNGLNFKSAFSPINHVCLQYNGRFSTSNTGKEFVVGIYNIFSPVNYNQLSFGYGEGKFDYADPINGSDFNLTEATGDYKKISGQLYFTFDKNKNKLQGFCIRMEKIKVSYSDANIKNLIGNTYEVLFLEPFYTVLFELGKHSTFCIYTGVVLNSQSNVIKTNAINVGAGLAIKLFNGSK